MVGVKQVLLGVALVAGTAMAEPYHDLGKVRQISCLSGTGRTQVLVQKAGPYHLITTIQDRRLVLHNRVPTSLRVQESFPATYIYAGRTSEATYLTLGQTTRDEDMKHFSRVKGTVRYVKSGMTFETPVTCAVW